MTARVARELIRAGHLVRGLRWAPLHVGTVTVGLLLVLRLSGLAVTGVMAARVVALVLALGSGFALDDQAASTVQASPYPLARRLWLRIAATAALVVPLWTLALPLVRVDPVLSLRLGLTVEFLAALAVVWATAAWCRRRGLDEPGVATAPVLLGLLVVCALYPRAPMLVPPGPQWLAAHVRWAGVLACATALLVWAVQADSRARR